MNIYLPAELQKQIDGFKDTNWSEVAQQAFRQKLGELAAKRKEELQNERRLSLLAQKRYRDGHKLAELVCTPSSESAVIRQLAIALHSFGYCPQYGVEEDFSQVLAIQLTDDVDHIDEFWERFSVTKENQKDPAFMRGFLDRVETYCKERELVASTNPSTPGNPTNPSHPSSH
jgi:hypothetical protein